MPVPESLVGRVYPPTEPYLVSREKIREFADAINDANPAYRSVDAARALGHPDVVAPPTFPIVLTIPAGHQLLFDPEADIDYGRVVHGEQRFEHARPVHAGDRLQVVVAVDGVRVAAGNELITTRSEVRTTDGELVVTAFATIVVRGPEK
jgi:acyl dehydratase